MRFMFGIICVSSSYVLLFDGKRDRTNAWVGTEAEFPGDASALEEFKNWYFDKPEAALKEEQYEYDADSGSDGGVAVRSRAGSRVGDGETEDRYADGETESTDGGAKLRWY